MIHRGLLIALATLWLSATIGIAQYQRGPGGPGAQPKRSDYPMWEIDSEFTQDVFTFARIQYDSAVYARRGMNWDNDFPD